ncbi:hypothetical protein [Spirosoma validum]|uniref:Uncharacterized protein n=1 Tax=Spirosoma validum TaxID=2771355 RepID=A0A927GFI0_9BACT|nr:hypothetical protein [Spirosoma validum]MBD2755605.1 hypothetical protein [Spirosoma validum]
MTISKNSQVTVSSFNRSDLRIRQHKSRENKRTLPVIMGNVSPYIRRESSWLSSLLAIWLLVSLQGRTTVIKSVAERQTFLYSTSFFQETDEMDSLPTDSVHTHAALVYPSPGFVFTTSTGFLPFSRYALPKIWRLYTTTSVQQSHFIFEILHLIFEHQIAINAP